MHTPARIQLPPLARTRFDDAERVPAEREARPLPPPESTRFDDLVFFGPIVLGTLFFATLVLGGSVSTLKELGWIP